MKKIQLSSIEVACLLSKEERAELLGGMYDEPLQHICMDPSLVCGGVMGCPRGMKCKPMTNSNFPYSTYCCVHELEPSPGDDPTILPPGPAIIL